MRQPPYDGKAGVPGDWLPSEDASETLHIDIVPGLKVLVSLSEYPPWPAIILHQNLVPPQLWVDRPKNSFKVWKSYFPIMLMGTHEYYWCPKDALGTAAVPRSGNSNLDDLKKAYEELDQGFDLATVERIQQNERNNTPESKLGDPSDNDDGSQVPSSQVPHSDDSTTSDYAASDRAINRILKKTEDHSSHLLRAFWDIIIDRFYRDRREEGRLPIDLFPAEVGLRFQFGPEIVTSRNDGAVVLHTMRGNKWTARNPVHPLLTLECKSDTGKTLPQVAGELLATLQHRTELLAFDRPLTSEESVVVAILIENISVKLVSLTATANQLQSLKDGNVPNQLITLRVSHAFSLGDDKERDVVLKYLTRILEAFTAPDSWVKGLE